MPRHSKPAPGLALWALVGLLAGACRLESSAEPRPEGSQPERVQIGSVHWYVDYEAAVQVAREQDKALWVHFGENPG